MATVIDSLVVMLGLNSSSFQQGMSGVNQSLKKTNDAANAASKDEAARQKRAEEGWRKLRQSALLFFAAVTGAGSIMGFVKNTVAMGATLDRSSKTLGVSANNLSKWGGAVKASGGTLEGFLGTMQNLNQQMTQLKETGDAPMRMLLNRLGVAAADETGKGKDLITLLSDIGSAMDKLQGVSESDKFNLLLGAGIDEGTARLMLRTEKERTELIASQMGMTDQQAKKMREIDERWQKIQDKYSAMARNLMEKLLPSVERLSDSLMRTFDHVAPIVTGIVEGFAKLNEYTDGWLAAILVGAAALKGVQMLLPGAAAAAAGGAGAAGTAAASAGAGVLSRMAGLAKLGVGAAALTYSGNLNSNEDAELAKRRAMGATIDKGPKPSTNVPFDLANELAQAERQNGLPEGLLTSIIQQETGGRQEFFDDPAKYHYEPDAKGKRKSSAFGLFGILDSTANKPGYGVAPLQDKSLREQIRFAAQYAAARIRASGGDIAKGIASYGEGAAYANQVLARLPNGVMSGVPQYSTQSMPVNETSITVGQVVVNTQAQDANGIARDIHGALVRQADSSIR